MWFLAGGGAPFLTGQVIQQRRDRDLTAGAGGEGIGAAERRHTEMRRPPEGEGGPLSRRWVGKEVRDAREAVRVRLLPGTEEHHRRVEDRSLILAVLVVLAVAGVWMAQKYIVYDDGGYHLELPFFQKEDRPRSRRTSGWR